MIWEHSFVNDLDQLLTVILIHVPCEIVLNNPITLRQNFFLENALTDIDLIRSGSKNAFEEVFRMHYPALCSHARKLLNDSDEAEEIVQDVFFKLWEKREQLNITASLKAYLFRSVHNACLNHIKHLKVRQAHADYIGSSHEVSINNNPAEYRELQQQIGQAMDALPEKCREVFELSRFEGLKYKEIADRLEISPKTVENQMGKAFKLLREKLHPYLKGALLWIYFSLFS